MSDEVPDEVLASVVVGEVREDSLPPAEQQSWPVDEVCAAAVDVARAILLEDVPAEQVGEHQGLIAEGPAVVTHYFAGQVPGYVGWRWAVTVTRVPDSDHVTVDETALIPNGDALLAPAWVPWKQRIQSGDIGAGDVMVTEPDDPRLIPGMSENDQPEPDAEQLHPEQWELGLGRERILSPYGRREAATRWYREVGPRAAVARASDLTCGSCGFLLLIGGPLGQAFGVCANMYSPADGRIVAMNFGCGAHSQTPQTETEVVAEAVVDDLRFQDLAEVPDPEPEPEPEPEPVAETEPSAAAEEEPQAPAEQAEGDENEVDS